MKSRPKISIPFEVFDIALEVFALSILLGFWYYCTTRFASLPETIPVHFNAAGEADRFGAKSSIFWLPSIATILHLLLTLIERIPHKFNYLVEISEKNAFYQYRLVLRFSRVIKILINALFAAIAWHSFRLANNHDTEITIPLFLVGMFFTATFIVYAILSSKH